MDEETEMEKIRLEAESAWATISKGRTDKLLSREDEKALFQAGFLIGKQSELLNNHSLLVQLRDVSVRNVELLRQLVYSQDLLNYMNAAHFQEHGVKVFPPP